jgi:hypothetical protein
MPKVSKAHFCMSVCVLPHIDLQLCMSVTVQCVAPLFACLSLSCLFCVLRPLLCFNPFNLLLSFLVLFDCFICLASCSVCSVICFVSSYVYCCSGLLCTVRCALQPVRNTTAENRYRIVSYLDIWMWMIPVCLYVDLYRHFDRIYI